MVATATSTMYRRIGQNGAAPGAQPARTPAAPAAPAAAPQRRTASQQTQAPATGKIAERESRKDEQFFDDNGDFNPRPLGKMGSHEGQLSLRGAKPSREGRLYDGKGEVNAFSKREAVEKIAHFVMNELSDPNVRRASRMDRSASRDERARRTAILRQAWSDPDPMARYMVAQEMKQPIEDILAYESVFRQLLRNVDVELGEYYRIPKDVNVTAMVVAPDGKAVEQRLKTEWVMPGRYRIMSNFSVDFEEAGMVSFDMFDRGSEKSGYNMKREEDKAGVRLLDAAAQDVNAVKGYSSIGPTVLEQLRYEVERWGYGTATYLMERMDLSDVVTQMASMLDPVSFREMNLTGQFGKFFNANIVVFSGVGPDQVMKPGTIYMVTDPDHLGEFITWTDVVTKPYDKAMLGEPGEGVLAYELVGLVIPVTRGVAKAVRSV